MSNELVILKELATISATSLELRGIAEVIAQQIRNAEFVAQFRLMEAELERCYQFVADTLKPFLALTTEAEFQAEFAHIQSGYQQNYLLEASKPRHAADATYEVFLELSLRKEMKTTYPLLQRTFGRLDYVIDKYVTNDAWLVMSIESVLKRLNRFLTEVAELRKIDREEAFLVYNALMLNVGCYLQLLQTPGRFVCRSAA